MTEFERIHCTVVPIDLIKPEDDSVESPVFSIDVEVNYTLIPDEMELGEEYEEDEEEFEYHTRRKIHEVEFDRIVGETSHVSAVWDILEDMEVPAEPHVVSEIVAKARDMARALTFRKVFRMRVSIDAFLSSVSVEEDGGVSCGYATEPADATTLEKNLTAVEEIRVGSECAICLEEIRVGSVAGRMPCLHVFHRTCVVQWLERTGSCPLCRFRFHG